MKRILILLFMVPFFALAQNKPLIIEGIAPNLYITHTVAPKENYYSVGRLYNVSPKEVAPFNNLDLDKGLNLGQVIKVPLTAANFSQDAAVLSDEVLVPVYHIVKEKEGLFRISSSYNKLSVDKIRQWNHLKSDAVNSGSKLIVGYLKVKKELSALSGMAKTVAPVAVNTVPKKEEAPKTTPVKETPKPEVSNETLPVVKNPAKEKKPETKPVEEPVKKDPPPVVKKEEKPEPVTETPKAKNFNGGFFKSMYNDQARGGDVSSENGTAAVFKSTSGWEDGKYYCLHNAAAPGTIVKLTSPTTGKSIYAKVLDVMPDIKQNNGVQIRISNAAAAELGLEDIKFECTLSYSK